MCKIVGCHSYQWHRHNLVIWWKITICLRSFLKTTCVAVLGVEININTKWIIKSSLELWRIEWAQAGESLGPSFPPTHSPLIFCCDLRMFLKKWVLLGVDTNWAWDSWNLICQCQALSFRWNMHHHPHPRVWQVELMGEPTGEFSVVSVGTCLSHVPLPLTPSCGLQRNCRGTARGRPVIWRTTFQEPRYKSDQCVLPSALAVDWVMRLGVGMEVGVGVGIALEWKTR